jgi:hypothetical protein
MAQSFNLPVGTDRLNVAIKTKIADSLEALRTTHSGSSAPTSTAANMLWVDTSGTPAVLKLRNTANTNWITLMSLGKTPTRRLGGDSVASLTGTTSVWLGPVTYACTVERLIVFSETASTSTSGNEWQFQVTNYPNSDPATPVDLISGTVGTFTTLVDVGGGTEFVANKALVFTPDQNLSLADNDILKVTVTEAGTATTLTNFHAYVDVI